MSQRFIYTFFLYLIFEGALRKWFLPSFSTELFLLKDIFILMSILAQGELLLSKSATPPYLTKFEILLICAWMFFFIGYFLLTGPSLSSLSGLRYYLVMLPIIFIFPRVVPSINHLKKIGLVYLLLALTVCMFGVVQYFSSPYSILNKYAWQSYDMTLAMVGARPRITGTFSYISPYAIFLQSCFVIGCGLLVLSNTTKEKFILSSFLAICLVNIAMTGSRGALLVSFIISLVFIIFSAKTFQFRIGIGKFFILLIVGLLVSHTFNDAFISISNRNTLANDSSGRILGSLLAPLNTLMQIDFLGDGIGSTFMGVREIQGRAESAEFDEVNIDRIGVETGILGFLLVLFFKLFFAFKTWNLIYKNINKQIKTLALVSLMIQLSFVWSIPVYNSVAAAFYFLAIGMYVFLRKWGQIAMSQKLHFSNG